MNHPWLLAGPDSVTRRLSLTKAIQDGEGKEGKTQGGGDKLVSEYCANSFRTYEGSTVCRANSVYFTRS
jgi:hypothetical protein